MESSSSSSPPAAAVVVAAEEGVEELTLTVKWSGKEFTVRICADDSVAELKRRICEATTVLPKRQKLLYPKLASKLGDDSLIISHLNLKPSIKMTMIGTVEDEIIVDQVDSPEIVDDFEFGQDEVVDIKDKDVNKEKLRRRVNHYKVTTNNNRRRSSPYIRILRDNKRPFLAAFACIRILRDNKRSPLAAFPCIWIKLLNPCREGKKLLVLDIDYTLFDHRSPAENPLELMRPYLHEFLSAAYSEYDIMIWSATSMKWVELKMGQLGVLSNPDYKITALLDHMAMITVQSDSQTFDCKPLGVIWAQLSEFYNSGNTIMFDDLRRNFVMNPQNGLTIRPFRKAHLNRGSDQELVKLTQYLLAIADLSDLSSLDHRNWESYTENIKRRRHR